MIAQSYLVLKLADRPLAVSLLEQLQPRVQMLAADAAVVGCRESNRRNRAKLLVSLCTTAYHLALMVGDDAALIWAWTEAMALAAKLQYSDLNADACLRMSSNLSRCLALGALLSDAMADGALERSLEAIEAVEDAVRRRCLSPSGESVSKTQENHLALMAQLEINLRRLRSDELRDRQSGVRRLSQLLNHSSARTLNAVIAERLLQCHGAHS